MARTAMLVIATFAVMSVAINAQTTIETPAGSFTTQASVDDQLQVSATVATIMQQLTDSDFTAAKQTYEDSNLLKAFGMGTGLSGLVFDQARAFFGGSADFNNQYLNEAFAVTEDPAKLEMVQKTVMDAIPVQAIASLAYSAAQNNDRTSWDEACSLYTGSAQNREATPYERAEKRAANFDTFTGNAATVNVNILQACSAGPSAENYETIMHNIEVLYAQASIRYARLLDIDYAEDLSTVDHRAEGQAFYRIIAPMVAATDSACNDVIDQLYNFEKTPVPGLQYYCEAVTCIPAALGITATELGTLEDTDGICEGTTPITTPAGVFTPQTPVFEQLQVSATVNNIMELLSEDDFTSAENTYVTSGLLRAYGQGQGLSGPVFEQAVTFFGSTDFNDRYLIDEAFTEDESAEIAEMVEKTVMDAIPVQAILSLAYAGRSGDRASWDQACALYMGRPHLESSPYERAEKRAANYGTTANGIARVNSAVLNACATPSVSNYEAILKAIKIIYVQATIRYAHLLDIDFREGLSTLDHRAEGQAFYRIIAPMVRAANAACDETLDELYNFSKQPDSSKTYYCEAVDCLPNALDLTVTDIGVLEDTQGVCGGGNSMMDDGNDDSSASALRVAAALLLSAVAAVFVL